MIRNGHRESGCGPPIQILKKRIDYALDFSDLLRIVPELRERVKFIQQEHAAIAICEVEQRTDIASRGSQERANQPVEASYDQIGSPNRSPSQYASFVLPVPGFPNSMHALGGDASEFLQAVRVAHSSITRSTAVASTSSKTSFLDDSTGK